MKVGSKTDILKSARAGCRRSRNPPPRCHQAADYASGSNPPYGLRAEAGSWHIASRQPGVSGQLTENLSPQGVTLRDTRVVEILRAIVRHPKLRHHASGSTVSEAR